MSRQPSSRRRHGVRNEPERQKPSRMPIVVVVVLVMAFAAGLQPGRPGPTDQLDAEQVQATTRDLLSDALQAFLEGLAREAMT